MSLSEPKIEFSDQEKAVYEFMVMFSLHEREMLEKLIVWYPKGARDLEKGLAKMRETQRLCLRQDSSIC
jgi:hypothetical protein